MGAPGLAISRHLQGKLTAAEGSAAKLFHTELQWEVCDAGLQLHGGAGYMNEYPIAPLVAPQSVRATTSFMISDVPP